MQNYDWFVHLFFLFNYQKKIWIKFNQIKPKSESETFVPPVKLYPGQGLKSPAPFLLDWLATSLLASLCRFLCRSQFPLKQVWLQKNEP